MLRQIIVPILIIVVAVFAYMGAYMPVKKASMYIETNNETRSYGSVTEIKQEFNKVFDYNSPVGQKEVSKFLMVSVLSLLDNQSQPVSEELVKYAESKIIEGEFLHILRVANMYNTLWQKFGDDKYFEKAEEYYLQAHEMGPRVPQPLHNLYIIYRNNGMDDKAEEISNKMLELWPQYEDLTEDGELDI